MVVTIKLEGHGYVYFCTHQKYDNLQSIYFRDLVVLLLRTITLTLALNVIVRFCSPLPDCKCQDILHTTNNL